MNNTNTVKENTTYFSDASVRAGDLIREARRINADGGSGRANGLDWTIQGDGKSIAVHHPITSNKFGTINLETGVVVPEQEKYRTKLMGVYSELARSAEVSRAKLDFSNLIQYPKNVSEVKSLLEQYPEVKSRISPAERKAVTPCE